MVTQFLLIILLVTVTSQATPAISPNSFDSEADLDKPNTISNRIKYSINSYSIPRRFAERNLLAKKHNPVKCSPICGILPPIEDCLRAVNGFNQHANICAPSESAVDITLGDCTIEFGHREAKKQCINPHVFFTLAKEILNTCLESEELGGCVTVPGNANLDVCIFFNGQRCSVDDLVL